MTLNAWNPPMGCYRYVAGGQAECPSALWFWLALAAAGIYVLAKK